MADEEDRQGRVREDDIEQQLAAAHVASQPPTIGRADAGLPIGITSGGAKGSRPDLLGRGALDGEAADPRHLRRAQSAKAGDDDVQHGLERAVLTLQPGSDELDRDAVLLQQPRADMIGRERGKLEHQRQIVRELVAGRIEPDTAIALLEREHRQPALATIAMHVVGDMEAALLAEVEGVDVEPLEIGNRSRRVPAAELMQLG